MPPELRDRLRLGLSCYWAGAVCAICFLEAWVKFRAPPLAADPLIGLQVGRVVFRSLHAVEVALLVFAMIISWNRQALAQPRRVFPTILKSRLWVVTVQLFIRVVVLMPVLEGHIDAKLAGQLPPTTWHHTAYGVLAGVQVLTLLSWGWSRSPGKACQGRALH